MKNLMMALVILISLSGLKANDEGIQVKYLRNYDGDTITVELTELGEMDKDSKFSLFWKKMSVRVNGVDTPELRTKCKNEKELGKKAKYLVRDAIKAASFLELKNIKKGKYFRIVADVYVDGVNLADLLFEANLAVPYFGKKKTYDWCAHKLN